MYNKKEYGDIYFFLLFWIHNILYMYTFLYKKKINSLLNSLKKKSKMYTFDQYIWLEITNHTTKQLISFAHFV